MENAVTKVKTIESTENSQTSPNSNSQTASQPDYRSIPRKDLRVSPTNPRRRINEQTIESLAESIRMQGVLEPLIVRKAGEKYEIVCGERRYRAASVAKLKDMPCLVRELSDEQVLDIQIHENLHREDVHPMDEAYGYHFLKEKLDCNVKELSLRVGKPEGYVLNRLKLNLLIDKAQKDVDEEHLPLSYALEIAKYSPEIQELIYEEVYRKQGKYQGDDYVYVAVKGEMVQWKSFIEWINTNVHRLLSKAPFDAKATNLREDGLACVKCPDRTGAAVSLFEPNQIGRKDACLNPACYKIKTQNFVQIRRRELAEIAHVKLSEVPIVRSWCYSDDDEYFGSESATVIGEKRGQSAKICKKAVKGIDIESDNYGKTVHVCLRSTQCKIHWPASKVLASGNSAKGVSADEAAAQHLETHRARREEIWNAKIAEAVRVRVFKRAAEKFEKKFRVTDVGTDFFPQLVARLWRMSASGDSNNLNGVVKYLIAEWEGESENKKDGIYMPDMRTATENIKKLDRAMQYRVLFLLIHANKGTIGYSNSYMSQKEVKDLATEFEVDYNLIDAEARLEFCAKKHKDVHEAYLSAVREKNKNATIPNLFSEKWKARD